MVHPKCPLQRIWRLDRRHRIGVSAALPGAPHARFSDHRDTEENRRRGARAPDREVVYTAVLKLSRGLATSMRVLGKEPVAYLSEPGTGLLFLSDLWHRTEAAEEGVAKLTLFFGRWR